MPPRDTETDQDRDACIAGFGALAKALQRSQESSGAGDVDQSVNIHFRELARLMESTGRPSPATDVVGPDAWFWVTTRLERYLSARPAYHRENAELIASTVGDELRRRRGDLRRYMDAIRNEMNAFQDGSESSAVALLLAEAREHVADLESAVSEITDEWYANKTRSDVRVRRDENGTVARDAATGRVVPEVRFEDDVPGWRPLYEFYGGSGDALFWRDTQGSDRVGTVEGYYQRYQGSEPPAWLQLKEECGERSVTRLSGWGVYGPREDRLRNAAVYFLHSDDVAPARLGLGTVSVCLIQHEAERGNNGELLWYRHRQIDLTFSFGWCPGEPKVVRLPPFPYIAHYDAGASIAGVNILNAATYAGKRMIGEAEAGRQNDRCRDGWGAYRARLSEKKAELAEFLREKLAARDALGLGAGKARMRAANEALQSWISVAFDRAIGRSDIVDLILSGRVAVPDSGVMLEDPGLRPWDVADEAVRRLERLETVLRSRAMEDAVEYGFGHRLLTEAGFAALGDAE